MRVLRYLWQGKRLLVYMALSIAVGLAMSLILWDYETVPLFFELFFKLFALSLLLFFLLRFADDYFDYEKDGETKEQPLSKRGILCLIIIAAAVYVALNCLFYLLLGLFGLLVVGYLLLQQKAQFLKPLFLPSVSAYYFYLNLPNDPPYLAIGIYLAVCLILSTAFYIFKKRRAK